MMTADELKFTWTWWEGLLADERRLIAWLQKLQGTEFSGYQDNRDAAAKWTVPGSPEERIFITTGDDEMKHSDILVDVLKGRGAWPIETPPPESIYWAKMEEGIDSLERCGAVFHLGEKLAAERFQAIQAHHKTPSDVAHFLRLALPDEQHHARIFRKIAGEAAIIEMQARHDAVVAEMKGC